MAVDTLIPILLLMNHTSRTLGQGFQLVILLHPLYHLSVGRLTVDWDDIDTRIYHGIAK